MDDGDEVTARIRRITGGEIDKPSYGVVIDINTTPGSGWEESDRETYEGEVAPSQKEALDVMQKAHDTVRDSLDVLSRLVSEIEKKTEKKTRKGFWKRIFGG